MKVGIYFSGFPPESGGGYTFEQDILTALNNLASQSHHRFVLFVNNVSFFKESIRMSGNFKIVLIENSSKFSNIRPLLRKAFQKMGFARLADQLGSLLQTAAAKEKIQFIWFPTPNYAPINIPYIATVWDIQHRIQPWFPEVSAMGEWAHRETFYATHLRKAAYIITPNQAGMRELSFTYGIQSERFRLLPHPTPKIGKLPTAGEINDVLQKYKISGKYLLYPAQFWAHKNHANLLSALQLLRDEYKISLPLVLIGSDQGNLQHIQNLTEQFGLEDQIHFLGFIPKMDLFALYCGAFALVYVSLFGPENLPPLEAFACSCPVIASNVPGASEQFGDAAILVNGLDAFEIATAIKRIIEDPDLRKSLIIKGLVRAQKFTGPDFVKGVFDILNEFELVRRNWE